jgi:hypothetical protein
MKIKDEFLTTHNEGTVKVSLEMGESASESSLSLTSWNGVLRGQKAFSGEPGVWTFASWLDGRAGRIDPQAVGDMVVICRYTAT